MNEYTIAKVVDKWTVRGPGLYMWSVKSVNQQEALELARLLQTAYDEGRKSMEEHAPA